MDTNYRSYLANIWQHALNTQSNFHYLFTYFSAFELYVVYTGNTIKISAQQSFIQQKFDEVLFFFRGSSGNQPTGPWSGILIPEPPCAIPTAVSALWPPFHSWGQQPVRRRRHFHHRPHCHFNWPSALSRLQVISHLALIQRWWSCAFILFLSTFPICTPTLHSGSHTSVLRLLILLLSQ